MKTTKWYALLTMVALATLLLTGMGTGRAAATPGSHSVTTSMAQPASNGNAAASQRVIPDAHKVVDGVACGQIYQMGIDKQTNIRAAQIMVGCGLEQKQASASGPANYSGSASHLVGPNLGGSDWDMITHEGTYPNVTQDQSSIEGIGPMIVGAYTDSSNTPGCYTGVSDSSDGGTSFTSTIITSICTGHGTNYGEPILAYSYRYGTYYLGGLATGCGGLGIGGWQSTDNGASWITRACEVIGADTDRPFQVYDNDSSSPNYGRLYVGYNDYSLGNATPIKVIFTDDNGSHWSSPITLPPPNGNNILRNMGIVTLPGSHGSGDGSSTGNSDVFVAGLDEGSGGTSNRVNLIYRSTDGGLSFTGVYTSTPFAPPGTMACGAGYFNAIAPIWRDMGWGQLAVTGNGILGYAYDTAGASGDAGDIRSTDNGTTWSNPMKLNTDSTLREQWMPSLVGSPSGAMFASWYDRRDTQVGDNHYKYYGRLSTDGGATWQADAPLSDVLSPQPLQPDPNIQACWTGDYNHQSTEDNTALLAWVDGRVPINGNSQQDLFFDKVDMGNGVATPTVTPGGPTVTPVPPTPTITPSPTVTPIPPTPQPTICANPFVDITSNIFFYAINYLYCNHVVNGTDASHYSPAGTSTRGQFAKVVTLGFGTPFYTPSGPPDFSDVPPTYFAYVYIESGFHAGILSGFDQASCTAAGQPYPCYLPNRAITRGQITKLVVNAANYPLYTPSSGQTFSDVPPSNVFFAAIETAHNKGVINGYPDGSFQPNANVRRDAMAQIVYKGVTTP